MSGKAENQTVEVPLPQYLEQVADRAAEKAAQRVIADHVKTCPMVGFRSKLYGFASGVSLVGGLIGWAVGRYVK